jgi:ribonuclease P protein component
LDARFPPAHRLRNRAGFTHVFRRNIRSADALFTVLVRPGDGRHPRLGLAISVRAAGGAVARNRIKRLVRESFRQRQGLMPAVDIVVMARPGIAARNNAEIGASLERHWERITQRCNRSSSA